MSKKNIEQGKVNKKNIWRKFLDLKLTDKLSIISFDHNQIILLIFSLLLIYLLILNSHLYIKILSIISLVSCQVCMLRKNLNTDNILHYGCYYINTGIVINII